MQCNCWSMQLKITECEREREREFASAHRTVSFSIEIEYREMRIIVVLTDITSRSNSVVPQHKPPSPVLPRTLTLSRQSGYCNSVSGNGTDKCFCGKWTAKRSSQRHYQQFHYLPQQLLMQCLHSPALLILGPLLPRCEITSCLRNSEQKASIHYFHTLALSANL